MARISITFPDEFNFSTVIPIRITDLNYGGHVGNDTILSLLHEVRMQFLHSYGYSEKDLGGTGMIMGDVAIVFKNEIFYGDVITAHVAVTEISRASFELLYKLTKQSGDKTIDVVHAKTGMVCFDYEKRRPVTIPDEVLKKWK